jgi:hypothetical protein
MKLRLVIVVTLMLAGCSPDHVPTIGPFPSPSPAVPTPPPPDPPPPGPTPPPRLTFVWVVVLDGSDGGGICVRDATVEIVTGQGLGRRIAQANECSYWDPDYDAMFEELVEGVELTMRASAPGYATEEKTVVPTFGGQQAVTFVLFRTS